MNENTVTLKLSDVPNFDLGMGVDPEKALRKVGAGLVKARAATIAGQYAVAPILPLVSEGATQSATAELVTSLGIPLSQPQVSKFGTAARIAGWIGGNGERPSFGGRSKVDPDAYADEITHYWAAYWSTRQDEYDALGVTLSHTLADWVGDEGTDRQAAVVTLARVFGSIDSFDSTGNGKRRHADDPRGPIVKDGPEGDSPEDEGDDGEDGDDAPTSWEVMLSNVVSVALGQGASAQDIIDRVYALVK